MPAGERLGREEIELMRRSGIRRVYELGTASEVGASGPLDSGREIEAPEVERFLAERARLLRLRDMAWVGQVEVDPDRIVSDPKGMLREGVLEKLLERTLEEQRPLGARWRNHLHAPKARAARNKSVTQEALAARDAALVALRQFQTLLQEGKRVELDALAAVAVDAVRWTLCDPDLALGLAASQQGCQDSGSKERCSWNLAVFVVAAAAELDYGLQQLHELAQAALLVPLVQPTNGDGCGVDRPLATAPYALSLLRRFDAVPAAVVSALVAGPTAGTIDAAEPSPYARLIQACANFADLVASTDPDAVKEAVGQATRGELDAAVVRALLKVVGRFPVGSWVTLSNGEVGRVVAVGRRDPARPQVWIQGCAGAESRYVTTADSPELRLELLGAAPQGTDELLGF